MLYPLFFTWLGRLRRHWPGAWRYCMAQYGAWLGLWAGLLALNPAKALVFVIVPQLHGLHWLLATNYLQHAHADGGPGRGAALSYARNFEGLLNPLLFNIGLHTAHHEHSRAHWAELTELHYGRYRDQVPAALNEGGLVPTCSAFSCWARSARASVPVPHGGQAHPLGRHAHHQRSSCPSRFIVSTWKAPAISCRASPCQ